MCQDPKQASRKVQKRSRQSTKTKKGAGPQETGPFHPPNKLGVKNPPNKWGFLLLHFILQVQQAGHN